MQVKRFFAADMRRAMQRVRAELKDDAAIISSRALAGGVELTASSAAPVAELPLVNPELAAELRKTQAAIAEARVRLTHSETGEPGQLFKEAQSAKPAPASPPSAPLAQTTVPVLAQFREELASLRELVEVQLGSLAWSRQQAEKPEQTGLWFRLARLGLPAELIQRLLQTVEHIKEPRLAFRHLLAQLTQQIPMQKQDPLKEGGCIALICWKTAAHNWRWCRWTAFVSVRTSSLKPWGVFWMCRFFKPIRLKNYPNCWSAFRISL